MNKLALAVAIALSGAAICFAFLRRFLVDQDLVGSVFELGVPLALSGLFLGAIATVHQSLKSKRIRPSFTALPGELVSFEQYTIPWYVMIVYGVLMVYPASQIGTLVVWLLGNFTGIFLTRAVSIVNVVCTSIAFLVFGSWVGSRGDRLHFLTLAAAVLIFKVVTTILGLLIAASSGLSALIAFVASLLLYLTLALIGLWRGRQSRLSKYVRYILSFLPPAAQLRVVNMTYEEAQMLASHRLREGPEGANEHRDRALTNQL